ncbi:MULTISPECIES: serine hydrolase [unclassified Geodermatophilus]
MTSVSPPPGRSRGGLRAHPVAAALPLVLAVVLAVGSAGVRDGMAGDPVSVAAAEPTVPQVARAESAVGTAPGPAPPPAVTAPPVDAAGVLAAVGAAAAEAGGSIDLVVVAADGTPLVSSPAAGDAVYTASLVKLFLVGRLLELEATGAVALTDRDRELMERAIVRSDDPATSVLWDRWEGAALVTQTAAEAGLTATAPPVTAGQWGEATTSAADVATLLSRLSGWLGSGPAATLLGWMRATAPTAADGFDQAFGLLAGGPAGTVAAKQGWMCCVDGGRQLHSAGVLPGGQAVVLLGDFPAATSWAEARSALDTAAAAVRAAVG